MDLHWARSCGGAGVCPAHRGLDGSTVKRWVFGLVFVLLAVPLLALQQELPAAAEEPATGRFASCLAGQRSGDLLVLMDESGSLRWTDPQGDRVVAAQFLLDRLTDLAERTRSELSIKLVGFGTRYLDHASPWVVASQDTLPALRESVAQYRDRDNELGTDYWLGLDGARQELAARQTGEVSRCQAVVFFSDGQLDIQPPRGEQPARPYAPNNPLRTEAERQAATAAAAESLCRPGGVADQLRTQGIVLFGVGLEGHDAAHPAPANQFDLMTSLATGAGPHPCGQVTNPAPGAFTLVKDLDDMLFAFEATVTGQPPQTAPICQKKSCSEGSYTVVLDPSVTKVSILGSTDVAGISLLITTPSGVEYESTPAASAVTAPLPFTGVSGTVRWFSDRSVNVSLLAGDAQAWRGAWTFTFVDKAAGSTGRQSRTSIDVTGDLLPTWNQPEGLMRIGDDIPLDIGIVNGGDQAVDPESLLGEATMDVALVDSQSVETTLKTGLTKSEISQPITFDARALPTGQYRLRLRLSVTTAAATKPDGTTIAGTKLTTQVKDVPFELLPPNGYPTVPARLDFGAVEGEITLQASLPIQGPGCVWVDTSATTFVTRPEGVTDLSISAAANSDQSCVRVEQGAVRQLPISLGSAQQGNGAVNGTMRVVLLPAEDPQVPQYVTVAFTGDAHKPLSTVNYGVALVVALLLGPGIPLALMYLFKWALASKIPPSTVNPVAMNIEVVDGLVMRDGRPLALHPADGQQLLTTNRGTRQLTVGDVKFKAVMGGSPFGSGYVRIVAPGRVSASDLQETASPRHPAQLPLAVHGHWVLLVTPGQSQRGELILLLDSAASQAEREAMVGDVQQRVPRMLADLSSAEPSAQASAAPPHAPQNPQAPDVFDPFA